MNEEIDKFTKTCEGIIKSFSDKINQMIPVNGDSGYIESMKVLNKEGGYTYVKSLGVVRSLGNRSFEIELYEENASTLADIESSLKSRGRTIKKNNKILGFYLPDISTSEIERIKKDANDLLTAFKSNINNQVKDIRNKLGIKTGKKVSDDLFRINKKIEESAKKFTDQMEVIFKSFLVKLQKI